MPWPGANLAINATRQAFGVSVQYTHTESGVVDTIRAPFDEAHEVVSVADGVEISSTEPVLDVKYADLSEAPSPYDTYLIVATGKTYEVVDIQDDSQTLSGKLISKAVD